MSTFPPHTSVPNFGTSQLAAADRVLQVLDTSTGAVKEASLQDVLDFLGTTLATLSGLESIEVSTAASLPGVFTLMPGLPTSDPSEAGQLWSNAGVLTVSAG